MPARTRHTVLALLAAALVVLAVTLRFGLSTDMPRTPLPTLATAVPVQQRAAAPESPGTAEIAPPAALPGLDAAPPPPSTVVPPTPEPLPPATAQADAPPAAVPSVPAPAGAERVPPNTATIPPNPAPATGEPAPPYYEPLLTWMRQQFGHFLDQMGSPFAKMSESQRDALFAEFLTWHRARTSADPAKPTSP